MNTEFVGTYYFALLVLLGILVFALRRKEED